MSTQAPVRDARDTRSQASVPAEIVAEPKRQFAPEVAIDADDLTIVRSEGALIAMGALTCLSVGAVLGARFLGRHVVHSERSVRRTTSSPHILVMLPFTAINFYGKHRRGNAVPRLHTRRGNAPLARTGWPHRATQLARLAAPYGAASRRMRQTAVLRGRALSARLGGH